MTALQEIDFGSSIEQYDHPVVPASCVPVKQPGVVQFSEFVMKTFGGKSSGIVRDCGVGKPSDHHEGRAWDWAVSADNPDDVNRVQALFQWLLATDKYGNEHAMIRRAGIVYMIWDRRIWSTMSKTWKPYSGASPHLDHVHISFGWPGARGQTSLYQWLKGNVPPEPPQHQTEPSGLLSALFLSAAAIGSYLIASIAAKNVKR